MRAAVAALLVATLSVPAAELVNGIVVKDGRAVQATSDWNPVDGALRSANKTGDLIANYSIGRGDFHVVARLRILKQKKSAATFFLDGTHFGPEGAAETIFANGPVFGKLLNIHCLNDTTASPH